MVCVFIWTQRSTCYLIDPIFWEDDPETEVYILWLSLISQIFSSWYVSLPKTDVLFIIGDWNAKVGSQVILGITGKFGLGVQNEAGKRLTEFCQENAQVIANTLFKQHKRSLYECTSPDGQ